MITFCGSWPHHFHCHCTEQHHRNSCRIFTSAFFTSAPLLCPLAPGWHWVLKMSNKIPTVNFVLGMMIKYRNKMYRELICIPGLFIQIKKQAFNYFVINVIILLYHFHMVSLGKNVMCTPLLVLPHPPKLPLYFKLQFSTD